MTFNRFLRKINMFSMENKKVGWIRHILTSISLVIFFIGCITLGYMGWVMATSTIISHYLTGNLMFTYSMDGIGLLLFLTGLTGWIAGASEKVCVLRLYLIVLVTGLALEIGAIIAVNVLNVKMDEILLHGWSELNEATHNIVQRKFDCCGFYGPLELVDRSSKIDDSCYSSEDVSFTNAQQRQLKQMGCGVYLKAWFEENKAIWCSIMACIGGLQLMCTVLCIHIIHKLKDKEEYTSTSSKKKKLRNQEPYSL